jgi:hypothetical protein
VLRLRDWIGGLLIIAATLLSARASKADLKPETLSSTEKA